MKRLVSKKLTRKDAGELFIEARQGNKEACWALIESVYGMFYSCAERYYEVHRDFEIHEMVSYFVDSIVDLIRNGTSAYDPERGDFTTWVYWHLRAAYQQYYRKKKRTPKSSDQVEIADKYNHVDCAINNIEIKEMLIAVDKTLSEREREIIFLYYGIKGSGKVTLESIGVTFGVTKERVRQIIETGIKKLKKHYGVRTKLDNTSHFSNSEVAFLKSNYRKLKAREIGAILGRSEYSVRTKIKKLGLSGGEPYGACETKSKY